MGTKTLNSLTTYLRGTAASVVFLTSTVFSALGQEAPRPEFPAGIRLAATTRGEAAINALGKRLPEVAAHYRKTPEEVRALFRSDRSLHADPTGRLFYACELHGQHQVESEEAPSESIGTTDPAPFPTAEAFLLHSRPGANRVIYLDFDGHTDTTAGYWKDGAASPPFDTNGDPVVFSTAERERIIYIWQRVAEDFAMFDINVTTEDPGVPALSKSNSSDLTYGIRVVIGGSSGGADDWYTSGAGGVAFVGTFDVSTDVPCWVFPGNLGSSEKNIAEAASHEAGHTLGLSHDGTSTAGYYSGQGNWAPIMGVGYSKEIVQWSKGEYTGANNLQDDLAVMLTQGAVYRPDDHGSTTATATVLSADTIPLLSEGVIEKRSDLDYFRIAAAGGSLGITVKPAPRDSNLRIEVKLYDAAGTVLQTASSTDTTAGTQAVTLTRSAAVGDYFFSVDGIGNGDPLATGYTDYASLGQYLVSITGVVPTGATWLPTAAGSHPWNTLANWSINPVPNAAGVTLRINNNIAGNQTINLATSATLGNLFLGDSNGTHGFTLASTGGTLTFDNLSASAGISKTSGTNDVISAPLTLAGVLVVNQSASGTLSLSGAVSGTGSLTKEGAGTLVLTGAKTYTGSTIATDGVLRLDSTDALPSGNLTLGGSGGVLGLASGNLSRVHGTGSNQVRWLGDGGFAAFGADRTVSPGTMSWASTTLDGNTLILSHTTADATLIWSSNLSFAGSARTIQVDDGTAAVDARISGVLSGGGTFNKTGGGTLELTNANTYTAATSVNDGLLLISNASALPTTNLIIGGGILGLGSTDLTARTIGTGASQVQWTADGGFAAIGANRAVKFSATAINWTATNFIGNGRALVLGHATANATLDWQQPISMNGGSRTVEVGDGPAEIDALMSGVISGGSAGNSPFNKTGEGTLAFTAQNTHNGDTNVNAGTLMIGNGGTTGGISQNSLNITVASGATLAVNRSDTVTQGSNTLKAAISGDGDFSQIGSGTTILTLANTHTGGTAINGGTLKLSGAGTPGAASSTVSVSTGGLLDLNGTNQSIKFTAGTGVGTVTNNSGSGTSTLTLAGTATINGSLVTISDSTTSGGKVAVVIQANTQPLNNLNTYSGGTTVNAGAFLYLTSANRNGAGTGPISLTALGAGGSTSSGLLVDGTTYANDLTGAGYVHCNANSGATAVTVTLTGNLNTSGPFIFRGGTGIAYDFAGNGTSSTLSGVIGSTTSMVNGAVASGRIIKSGTGMLTLSGANTYNGSTTLSGGILRATNSASALGAGALTLGGGTLQLANDTGLSFGRNTTVTAASAIASDRRTSGAGVTHTLGTLSIGAFQLDVAPGSNATGSTAAIAFGNTTLTGNAIVNVSANSTLNLNGTVGGAFSLKVSGAGKVVFGGVLGNSGGLLINSGSTASITNNNSISGTIPLRVDGTLTNGGTEIFGVLNGSGTIKQTANSLYTNSSINGNFSGSITGAGGYVKQGTSTQTLSGVNAYTGNTTVSAGTLALADNAQLTFVTGATTGSNNNLAGAGTVIIDGDFNIDTSLTDASALTSGSWTLVNAATLSETFGVTFTLVGAGWSETSNVWTKTVGIRKYTFTEATGILAMTKSGYASWASTNAPTGTVGDDFDGDGVTNGAEYVLGGGKDTKDTGKLPTIATSGGNLTFTFFRDQASIDGTTTVEINTSLDLTDWTTTYPVPDGVAAANPGVTVLKDTSPGFDTVRLTLPQAPDAKKFARLNIVATP